MNTKSKLRRRLPLALALGASLTVALLPGCKEPQEQLAAPRQVTLGETASVEEAFPGRTGTIREGSLDGMPITYEEIDGQAVFEGDILLSKQQLGDSAVSPTGRTSAAAASGSAYRWPARMIYYTIDPALPNKNRVMDAITHWEQKTNIRFKVRSIESDYVTFKSGSGSSSYLGRVGGQQFITLGNGSTTGNVVHEIGHTVGLFHEHSRSDRDQHIVIHWNNIQPGKSGQFTKYTQWPVNYGGIDHNGFNFASRMMFPPNAYAIDPAKPTISKVGGGSYSAYPSSILSPGDIACVNDLYPAGFYQLPGQAYNVGAGGEGNVFIVSTKAVNSPQFKGYEIHRWNAAATSWEKLPIAGVDVDVNLYHMPWVVDAQHQIHRYNGTSWEKMPGAARAVGAGHSSVYIISNTPAPGGYVIQRWTGTEWKNVGIRGGVAIDVDNNGVAWMINDLHNIYRLNANQQWEPMPGKATDIGIGSGVFVTGITADAEGNYQIYKWVGSGWLAQTGRARKITGDNFGPGKPYIVKANHTIYSRGAIVYTPPQ